MYQISINNNMYAMNVRKNQYSNINFKGPYQNATVSTISKLKAMPFDEFFAEAKRLMENMKKTNSMYTSDNQAIIRFINKRLESYEARMDSHEEQLNASIQKIQDSIRAAYIKGNKTSIEKYANNPELPQELRDEAKKYLDRLTRNF